MKRLASVARTVCIAFPGIRRKSPGRSTCQAASIWNSMAPGQEEDRGFPRHGMGRDLHSGIQGGQDDLRLAGQIQKGDHAALAWLDREQVIQ